VQLKHILAGKRVGRGKIKGEAFIEGAAVCGAEAGALRMSRGRQCTQQ